MRMLSGTRALTGAGLVLVLFFGLKPAQAEPDRIEVVLDQAKVLKMPKDAQTVIIGNPVVADITVLKNRSMILTAKGYGVTNMIALDAQGAQISESIIEVKAAKEKVLILQLGMDRESYSCVPECMPFVSPGDSNQFTSSAISSISSHNGLAAPAAAAATQATGQK